MDHGSHENLSPDCVGVCMCVWLLQLASIDLVAKHRTGQMCSKQDGCFSMTGLCATAMAITVAMVITMVFITITIAATIVIPITIATSA